jgi:cytochrome c553
MKNKFLLLLISFTIFLNLFCGETQTKKDKEKDILATLVINGLTYNVKNPVLAAATVSAACKTGFPALVTSLSSACASCHGSTATTKIVNNDTSYAQLTSTTYMTPGNPATSKLYTAVTSYSAMSGISAADKTAAQDAISKWIISCKP